MNRMRELYGGAVVSKYQQPDEDLDALVSVVNDDDVTNMMEEYEKLGSGDGFTRLRIFLFSHPDQDGSLHYVEGDNRETERRYVDALNNMNDGNELRKLQQPDSPVISTVDDVQGAERFFNTMSLAGGIHNQLQYNMHHLTIPHVGSGQLQQSVAQRHEMEVLKESELSNAHGEVETKSDNDNVNTSKIEPTKAEAEAIERGLQTIKNDDLEEIRELGMELFSMGSGRVLILQ
ncbi:hypothetical protein LWI28_001916 [Acer negundo]|uniref:PB1 domain-containing protein n=1 Tax=Acer negundo TaxID=4023 RepID=A0AAD5IY67_ACENE|nr:hypothetical protein LWI28_001916 [Acer negundo]